MKDTTGQTNGVGNNELATGVYSLPTAEMIKSDVLTDAMSGLGTTGWKKREVTTDYCYYPELEVFYGDGESDTTQKTASEKSVRVTRRDVVVSNVIATNITYGQALSASTLSGGTATGSSYPSPSVSGVYAWDNDAEILPSGIHPCIVIFTPDSKLYKPKQFEVQVTVTQWSPTLALTANPASPLVLPGSITLTAVLTGAAGGNTGKSITITVNGTSYNCTTDSSGTAKYIIANPDVCPC